MRIFKRGQPVTELVAETVASKFPAGTTDQDTHIHALAAVGVQDGMRRPLEPPFTIVLYGCKLCSFVQDVTLSGKWTLEQVTRLHRADDGELYDPEQEQQ